MTTISSHDVSGIAGMIQKLGIRRQRLLVAIAGAPGAGKSTFSEQLVSAFPPGTAAVLPMDGFHFDNAVLESLGLLRRKGAPETFDFEGFSSTLRRIRDVETVAIPIFDRALDLARAGASIVATDVKFVIVEGNYLLLDEAPWSSLGPRFDFRIFVDVPRPELKERLTSRWINLGFSAEDALNRVRDSDMPNVERVIRRRLNEDLCVRG